MQNKIVINKMSIFFTLSNKIIEDKYTLKTKNIKLYNYPC